MGLLDLINSDDPAVKQGLLQFGLGLLSSKGNFGNALGNAGQQGLQGAMQYADRQAQQKRMGLQDQLTQGQIAAQGQQQKTFEQQQAEWQRQQDLRNLPGQFVTPGMKPDTMDNRDVGMPGEQAIKPGTVDVPAYMSALQSRDFPAWLDLSQKMAKVDDEYSTTPQTDQAGRLFVTNKRGGVKYLTGPDSTPLTARDKVEFVNGVAVNPYQTKPGTVGPQDVNKPFLYGPDGKMTANELYQKYTLTNAKASAPTVNNVLPDNLGLKPKDRFEMEGKLGDDYRAAIKSDQAILSSVGKIKTLVSGNSPLKDQSAIYSFAKMLDPEGAVRESDYAAIANTAGGLDRIRNLFNKALTGEYLSPNQRKDMANVAAEFERVSSERIRRANKLYGDQAKRYNLDPSAFSIDPQPKAATPGAATVDPSDPLGLRK